MEIVIVGAIIMFVLVYNNTIDKDKLNQSMKDCYYHLNHYFSDIYQKAIEPLQKEIKLLTESYELSKKNNTTILNLVTF